MITAKPYKCARCGFIKQIDTNHFGECYSAGRFNCCPNCPPWAKYAEFGGSTTWQCQAEPPPGERIPPKWEKVTIAEENVTIGVHRPAKKGKK